MRRYFPLVLSALLFLVFSAGCESKSSSTAVVSSGKGVSVTRDGDVSEVIEVDPEATEVRLRLDNSGALFFDDESWVNAYDVVKRGWLEDERRLKPSRRTIQEAIFERYPTFTITRILRSEKYRVVVYFISLKSNGAHLRRY